MNRAVHPYFYALKFLSELNMVSRKRRFASGRRVGNYETNSSRPVTTEMIAYEIYIISDKTSKIVPHFL
jgi:hypothetical protein